MKFDVCIDALGLAKAISLQIIYSSYFLFHLLNPFPKSVFPHLPSFSHPSKVLPPLRWLMEICLTTFTSPEVHTGYVITVDLLWYLPGQEVKG